MQVAVTARLPSTLNRLGFHAMLQRPFTYCDIEFGRLFVRQANLACVEATK
jgi:hypothetical protein